MIQHRKTIVGATTVGAAAIAALLIGIPALATPSTGGFSPSAISLGVFDSLDIKADKTGKWDLTLRAKGQTDVRTTRVTFPAGSSSGWHSHPGPNLLTVVQGEVVEYEADNPTCPGTTYHTGDTFGDNGGNSVHNVRNESGATAVVIAVALYPHGVTPITDFSPPRPTNCPANIL